MTPEIRDEVSRLCQGVQPAIDLIHDAWSHCEVWDDLVDKDKDVSADQVNKLMKWALFDVHQNPVFQSTPQLHFLLRVVVANWLAANELEKSEIREERVTAYTLRCAPYDFFVGVVLAVSGGAAADEAARYFRSLPSPDRISEIIEQVGV